MRSASSGFQAKNVRFALKLSSAKKIYCAKHQRAFECIQKIAYAKVKKKIQSKGKSAKAKRPKRSRKNKQASDSSSDAESSCSVENPDSSPEYTAFKQIFGGKKSPGLPHVATQTLIDFCLRFPDGNGNSKRTDGSFSLTSFIESSGTRVSDEDIQANPKMDYELFCIEMENKRHWKPQQCFEEWEKLKADKSVDRNELGRFGLQLAIPGSWLGADMGVKRLSNFEEKRVNTATKAVKNIAWDKREEMVAETRFGFNVDKVDSAKMDLSSCIGISPAKGPVNGSELLMAAASNLAPDSSASEALGDCQARPSMLACGFAPLDSAARPREKRNKADVAMLRLSSSRDAAKQIGKAVKEIKKELEKIPAAVTCMEYNMYKQRIKVAYAFLGKIPKLTSDHDLDNTNPQGEDMVFRDPAAAAKEATFTLQEHLKASSLPLDEPEAMTSLLEVTKLADSIAQAADADAVQEACLQIEKQMALVNQVLEGIRSTKKALTRVINDNKKLVSQQTKADADRVASGAAAQRQADRDIFNGDGMEAVFGLPWKDTGFDELKGYTEEEFKADHKDPANVFDKPFVVRQVHKLEEITDEKSSLVIGNVSKRFHDTFSSAQGTKRQGYTQAPAEDKHGVGELASTWAQFVPPSLCTDTSTERVIVAPFFVGVASGKAWVHCNPELLGCALATLAGTMRVLMYPAQELTKI